MGADHTGPGGWGLTLHLVTRRGLTAAGPHVVLTLTGALISPTASAARERLHQLLIEERTDVIVDLRALRLLDSVGVGVLVTVALLAPTSGCVHVVADSGPSARAWHRAEQPACCDQRPHWPQPAWPALATAQSRRAARAGRFEESDSAHPRRPGRSQRPVPGVVVVGRSPTRRPPERGPALPREARPGLRDLLG